MGAHFLLRFDIHPLADQQCRHQRGSYLTLEYCAQCCQCRSVAEMTPAQNQPQRHHDSPLALGMASKVGFYIEQKTQITGHLLQLVPVAVEGLFFRFAPPGFGAEAATDRHCCEESPHLRLGNLFLTRQITAERGEYQLENSRRIGIALFEAQRPALVRSCTDAGLRGKHFFIGTGIGCGHDFSSPAGALYLVDSEIHKLLGIDVFRQ